MAKCKACPHKKTCRDECYGENPCHFARAYDRLTRKVEARDDVIQRQRVELGGLRKCSLAEHSRMFGDYVLTPVQDAFTGKIGWWISKKGFTTARYCFTASDEKEVEYQIKNGLSGHMSLLDDTLDGADAVDRIDRFLKDLLWALPKEPRGGPDEDPGFWTDGDEILCPSEMERRFWLHFWRMRSGNCPPSQSAQGTMTRKRTREMAELMNVPDFTTSNLNESDE